MFDALFYRYYLYFSVTCGRLLPCLNMDIRRKMDDIRQNTSESGSWLHWPNPSLVTMPMQTSELLLTLLINSDICLHPGEMNWDLRHYSVMKHPNSVQISNSRSFQPLSWQWQRKLCQIVIQLCLCRGGYGLGDIPQSLLALLAK